MEIADEQTHRALAYIDAATRSGGTLSTEELNEYALSPFRQKSTSYPSFINNQLAAIARVAAIVGTAVVRDNESVSDYLRRVHWVKVSSATVALTPLGRAILSSLDRPRIDTDSSDPISVIIDPDDPMAYPRIFSLVVSHGEGMLVDPHLGHKQLIDLLTVPSAKRVLLSDKNKTNEHPMMSKVLALTPEPPAVRYLPLGEMHDRFFISDVGAVLVFGSSLNSITKRPGVVTPLADPAGSKAIRDTYARLWKKAKPIEPAPDAAALAASLANAETDRANV